MDVQNRAGALLAKVEPAAIHYDDDGDDEAAVVLTVPSLANSGIVFDLAETRALANVLSLTADMSEGV